MTTRFVIDAPLSGITSDSRKVKKNMLFVAFPGEQVDGRQYIAEAIENGAAAVLWEEYGFDWGANWEVKNVPVSGLKLQAGYIASQFYKKPSSKLLVVGVTGTNGKTSVTHGIAQAMAYLEKNTAVVGTMGSGQIDALVPTQNTTPGPIDLQEMFAEFVRDDIETVAMEVSSHGLDQGRLNGVEFDVAVFTNLTQDHLDYHKTIKAYKEAKRKLFAFPSLKTCVVNSDDPYGKKLATELNEEERSLLTYGLKSGDVRATRVEYFDTYFKAYVTAPQGRADVEVNLIGEFNVYNTLAILATLLASDVPFDQAINAISQLSPVAGRMEMYGGGDQPLVVVDYAHTPDALEKVLKALKTDVRSKLVCVFGCGGDRDVSKRAKMGYAVSKYANAAVVTSDNPRNENAQKIIQDITASMSGNFLIEPDRAKAIAIGIMAAKSGDVVLVAGKGHEAYQEIEGVRHHFSDAEHVRLALGLDEEVPS